MAEKLNSLCRERRNVAQKLFQVAAVNDSELLPVADVVKTTHEVLFPFGIKKKSAFEVM